MNRDEARILLESSRPGGQDAADPRVAEALRVAETDPELARLLESQRAFDASMAAGVQGIPVPAHLKTSLLAPRRIVRPHFWQDWRTASAAAAAVLLLLASGIWFLQQDATGFAEFRRSLIEERGSVYARMDIESTDLARVRNWLAGAGAPASFTIPAGLKDWRLQGASVVDQGGRKVSVLALASGTRRLNLFVLEGVPFADLPSPEAPDFERCGAWSTASWQRGSTTYVLSGLKVQSFMSKFRKAGRWTLIDPKDGAAWPGWEPAPAG